MLHLAATTTYPNLNIIERKFKRQILMPDPIILELRPRQGPDYLATTASDLDNNL